MLRPSVNQLLKVLTVSLAGIPLLATAAQAQSILRLSPDTSSFENLELTDGDIGVRVSYDQYDNLAEADDTNLRYQLVYQEEDRQQLDELTFVFAEFELRDLDGDGIAEVIARNYSGGAHCCTNTAIHRWSGTEFVTTETGYIDGMGAWIKDIDGDGTAEVTILDQSFLYRFGSYVESFPPTNIFAYRGDELVDITRQFPEQLREQAETVKTTFFEVQSEYEIVSNSMLASYVAYHAMLNEEFEVAWQFMLDNYDPEPRWGLEIYEDGEQVGEHRDFPTALKLFLMETGYLNEAGKPIQ
ncbi:MAG: VCBS repeat-containing protein [Cyanobacteria bacterium P01_D01_bin.156]